MARQTRKRRMKPTGLAMSPTRRFTPELRPLEDRTVPATFFFDPTIPNTAQEGDLVSFNKDFAGRVDNLLLAYTFDYWNITQAGDPTAKFLFTDLSLALEVASANPGPDTIQIAQTPTPIVLDNSGTPTIAINHEVTLAGSGIGASIITPTVGTPGAFDPLFNIPMGGVVNFTNLTLSGKTAAGTQLAIGGAIGYIDGGKGMVDTVTISDFIFEPNVQSLGYGVDALRTDGVTVQNSTITGYGRVGVGFTSSSGLVAGNTITGRGAGDFVNYGVQVIGQSANGGVIITGNTITGNTAEANDGSTSAAVFVSRDVDLNDQPIGPGGNATLIGNTLTNNGTGILIGTTFPDDTSKVTANFNNIFGNTIGVDATKSATDPNSGVDARFNWWGDFSGPQRDDGQGSGGSPPNPGGQGNEAEGNVFIEDPRPVPTPVLVATSKDDYLAQTTGITTVPVTIAPNPLPSQPVTDGSAEFNVTFGSPLQNVTTDEEFTFTANDVIATYNGAAVPVGQIAVVLDGSRTKASVTVSGLTGRGVLDVSVITGAALSESGFLTLASGTASALIGTPNQQPVILPNPPADLLLAVGGTSNPIAVNVTDDVGVVNVTVTSSNPAVATAAITGNGPNYSVTVSGVAGATGSSTITIRAVDTDGAVSVTAFNVRVGDGNAPTISPINDVNVTSPGSTIGPISVTLGSTQTPVDQLQVTVESSNPNVARPTITGTGANRSISVQTFPGVTGVATITVRVRDAQGLVTTESFTVGVGSQLFRGELFAASGGPGGSPVVQVYAKDGAERFQLVPFELRYTGGVSVATADVNGDGNDDVIMGAGIGGGARVRVVDGLTGVTLADFFAFEESLRTGVNVAAGDLNGDGKAEIIVGAGVGGAPRVAVFSLGTANKLTPLANFYAFDSSQRFGVNVGVANGQILAGAGNGGAPRVGIFSATGAPVSSFFAFDSSRLNGVTVAGADTDGDGTQEIVTGAGVDGNSLVRVFSTAGKQLAEVAAYPEPSSRSLAVNVSSTRFEGQSSDFIVTGPGIGGGPHLRVHNPASPNVYPFQDFTFDPIFRGGIDVG